MKKAIVLLLTAVMLLSTAACGGGTAAPAGNASTGPKDTLVWVQGADITSLDPHVGKETPAVQVTCNIFDTLMWMDENNQPAPNLAESWENIDELTWKFKLREDVVFHDGSKMTSADVVFSLERAIASQYVNYIVDFIDSVTADDDYNITIKTKAPYAPILSNLAVPFSAIVPKATVEADEEAFVRNPIGTGAYKFVEWKQGDYVKLEANENYWKGAPKTKNLQMKVVPEPAQRTIALETGEADFAYEIAPNDLSKIESNENLVLFNGPSLSVFYLTINNTKEPFDDVKVRQAIRYAIDSQLIIDSILYGAAEKADSLIPPKAFGHSAKSVPYEYNLEKAKALMKEAGLENGFECELSVNDNPTRVEVCQVIQSQLKEIGIECRIQVLEFGTWIDQLGTGSHDMSFAGWTCSTADADYTYNAVFHSTQVGYPGNDAFIKNKDVDKFVEGGRTTADPAERQKFYDQLEELLGELSPYAPIYYNNVNVGANKNVQGLIVDPNGYHRLYQVSVGG